MDIFSLECLVFLSSLGARGSLKHSPAPRPCCSCAFSREQSWDPAPGISLAGLREGREPPHTGITGLPAFPAPIWLIRFNSTFGKISGIPGIAAGQECIHTMLGGEL